jgi:hypothetical protein
MPDIGTGICGCIKLRMDGDVINSENIQVVFKVKTKNILHFSEDIIQFTHQRSLRLTMLPSLNWGKLPIFSTYFSAPSTTMITKQWRLSKKCRF